MALMAVFDSYDTKCRKRGRARVRGSWTLVGWSVGRWGRQVDQGWCIHFEDCVGNGEAMVLVFALIPLDIRCTPVGDVEGGLKRNRESATGSNKECACTCVSADQAWPLARKDF